MPTLNWIGKEKVINHHQDVPYKILEPQYGFTNGVQQNEPNNSGNKIIHGDNLEALKSLLPEYEGKIKCIYIDPPYNTGNESWVYNDNVNHPKIKKWLGEVVGKDGEDLTRHDKWLCMMYPRLKLLHKLLAKDGAIFISIDDNEQAYLKLLCDEIFGANNFVGNIAVVNNFKGRSDDKFIATAHESLLIFHKGNFITNGVEIPSEYSTEYKEKDSVGNYRLLGLRKRGSNSREIDRPNLFYPIYFDEKSNKISLDKNDDLIEILPKLSNGENGNWRWGKETLAKRVDEVEIRIVKTRNEFDVFQKDYLEKEGINKRIKPKSFWHGSEFSSEAGTLQLKKIFQEKTFDTPKSVDFIEYCLQQATDKNSIILDSFAGSGTTAHAVLNLNNHDGGNRKFILIEMEDYANRITAERVKRVINGYGEESKKIEGTDGSFNFYQLGEPLFLEEDVLNEAVGIENILKYIWYSETRTALSNDYSFGKNWNNDNYRIGSKDQTDYYFYYTVDAVTTVDYDFMAKIKHKASQYIIYADNCLLEKDFMLKHHIIFKKIPRDITRF
ncbi:type III restriction endonuclease subunit M [Flavobacterium psychrophilum]|uniref:site-specific DNA-methyltransferase (adenine-specific) n=1 Tax=Flavobacterium psychrophilum (strain ATCC 49511 / DSM 21280 / CIP 103535 / JIP02/86) TaxID=402612 RepID=A6H1K6_FLAPJ|nr:site-specific DNA-methyltransferase [Flavobacterium psychrophilum]AIG30907.1 type III restriction endonuclease subunit M [Flavobacterium psychrophilum]AIG33180.1 type III restriction endonuclease subunit M [Flavobacterium psychrophilum]AIG35333.1 type III restriction endonuclease subunit M [Flavobacterium psychrophilum]AIG37694.1 type III restriction endonuclease subunit M [Flavobacterium psychrophilum]AIG39966.1 type III restriction endonuclease subunit M [Flavobacterium psychrophilum]